MEKVLVTVELTDNNYCAYLEKLPGCVSTGKTFDELKKNIAEAAAFHLAQRYVKRATTFDRLKIINKIADLRFRQLFHKGCRLLLRRSM